MEMICHVLIILHQNTKYNIFSVDLKIFVAVSFLYSSLLSLHIQKLHIRICLVINSRQQVELQSKVYSLKFTTTKKLEYKQVKYL